jgi:N-acetylmuramoyl-L-alanine amidase
MSEKTIGLYIGHSRRVHGRPEGGALAADGKTSEWRWNCRLAADIAQELHDRHRLTPVLVDNYPGETYGAAMRWVGQHTAEENITLAVELHFNASSPEANGHEWLHWHSSHKGKLAATELHLAMSQAFPGIRARGVKPLTATERGGLFLRETHCPAVIAEPFFGTHKADFTAALAGRESLARALAAGLAAAAARL